MEMPFWKSLPQAPSCLLFQLSISLQLHCVALLVRFWGLVLLVPLFFSLLTQFTSDSLGGHFRLLLSSGASGERKYLGRPALHLAAEEEGDGYACEQAGAGTLVDMHTHMRRHMHVCTHLHMRLHPCTQAG